MRRAAFAMTLLLAACGGTVSARTQYLLRAETPERIARVAGPARVGLEQVSVAPYLDQEGIVVENGAREVRPARSHLWAEPLEDGLRMLVRAELATALGEDVGARPADRGPWEQTVRIFVEQLHGTMNGRAVLVSDFWIESRAMPGAPAEYRFAKSQALTREGYAGLVDAEAELARQLAQAIAAALRELGF